ncbi:hypothetical protein [Halovivax gelatinilyticus]|uniref:hypothetical protein n=1 Tax=Halovivax gelatinilyticus TaxID=2961597 RepID=UPI0020CA43BA|nr:hypothetical protein [Halovivax gelatinilyticus]
MSVPHPGTDPNAHLYTQLKRDVLDRIPHIKSVEYRPDPVEATSLCGVFDPNRLDPPTGPDDPEVTIVWVRSTPHDWFRVDYVDPNTNFHAGWYQDEDHPELGPTHFQCTRETGTERRAVRFEHETPSLILWEIVEALLENVIPDAQPDRGTDAT